jgi:hypothetical protein
MFLELKAATMNALTIVPAASVPASLAEAELDAALSFAEQENSAATRRAYRSDWRIFTAWCALRDLEPLPAAPGTVARFLSSQATAGVKASTISRRCQRQSAMRTNWPDTVSPRPTLRQ